MANDDSIMAWSTMWSCWRGQPPEIQGLWMFGNSGLLSHLKDSMKTCTSDVQEDMFEHAPKDVQDYFGYISKAELKAKASKKKSTYNESYHSVLLDKIRGVSA